MPKSFEKFKFNPCNSAYARGADDQQKRVRESNQNTSTPKTRAQSQTPPEQAANGPIPSQPVSICFFFFFFFLKEIKFILR
jgi:hypothetical protein